MRVNVGNISKPKLEDRYATVNLSWDEIKALCSGGIIRSRLTNEMADRLYSVLLRNGVDVANEHYSTVAAQELINPNGQSGPSDTT